MNLPRTLPFLPALLMAVLAHSAAEAGPIWTITSDARGGVGDLETVTFTFNGATETGLAGALTTTLPGGSTVTTYCVDLYDITYVGNGGSTWTAEVLPIASFAGSSTQTPAGGNAGAIGYLYDRFAASATTPILAAALQVAIWKVEYDGNASFSTGNFQFADSGDLGSVQHQVFAQATIDLQGFNGSQSSGDATLFRATSHPGGLYQDLVGPGSLTAVPEPASIALVATGLGAALVLGVRRNRRAS